MGWPAGRFMTRRRLLRRLLVAGILLGIVVLALPPGDLGAQDTVSLEGGWNNVAYSGETLPLDEAFGSTLPLVESVWQWRALTQDWLAAFTTQPAVSSLGTIENGAAYWILASRDTTWRIATGVLFQRATLAVDRASESTLSLEIDLADTPSRRSRGLMFRETLPDGAGMLFLFPADTGGGFWMRNTLVSLSIAFIGFGGRIQEIRDMEPLDETVVAPSDAYRWALEVNQGWFAANGVTVGDSVRLTGS